MFIDFINTCYKVCKNMTKTFLALQSTHKKSIRAPRRFAPTNNPPNYNYHTHVPMTRILYTGNISTVRGGARTKQGFATSHTLWYSIVPGYPVHAKYADQPWARQCSTATPTGASFQSVKHCSFENKNPATSLLRPPAHPSGLFLPKSDSDSTCCPSVSCLAHSQLTPLDLEEYRIAWLTRESVGDAAGLAHVRHGASGALRARLGHGARAGVTNSPFGAKFRVQGAGASARE